ncbi:MSMEG_0569 family flavin-dependent oxidoreductase [Microbacterium sp. SORGH_AS_0888]|uniref:MSMEG_0569 family flavin-dependent oxidoreductase n=1 Tax=Microbacterium sp. SORGH_AS_0888 TaxID=3041791 RepID=UPI00278243E7|nr:MSMEG_0569 family flavin-dependent oxidoreductase [Microbacterium sp. SORGH_AS_0888]MDQ1129199.1 putative flavoprotein involved in K+ transport [Microbacterium sp. SORGH_AS_0888]
MIPITVQDGDHYPAVIVGGGQAGLAVSWHLTHAGIPHVVLERDSVAHEWRDGRWDNFTLVTPNWHCRLPGYAYEGPAPDGFMTRDQVYAWVRAYADTFETPVAEGVEVHGVSRRPDGTFSVTTSAGTITADTVTSATGGYHRPVTPDWADLLPPTVVQMHSHHYRNAGQLPDGPILVVGTGQSGTQIAEDLHLEGRPVHLAVGRAPRVARFYRGRDCMTWLAEMGVYDIPVSTRGLAKRESTNHYVTGRDGGRDIDLRAFAAQGMTLHGRARGIADGAVQFDDTLAQNLDHADSVAESIKNDIDAYIAREGIDAPVEERYTAVWTPPAGPSRLPLDRIAGVVWAIGFRADWSWLDGLGVLDPEGHPAHERGATAVPGFHFIGLPWLHTWGSGRFHAIARDAEHVAGLISDTVRAALASR